MKNYFLILIIAILFVSCKFADVGSTTGTPPVDDTFILHDQVMTSGSAYKVKKWSDYAFVADDTDGLSMYDVSEPEFVVLLDIYYTSDLITDIEINSGIIYITLENQGLTVLEIDDFDYFNEITSIAIDNPVDMDISGDQLFVLDKEDGYYIYDISDPAYIIYENHYSGNSSSFEDTSIDVVYPYIFISSDYIITIYKLDDFNDYFEITYINFDDFVHQVQVYDNSMFILTDNGMVQYTLDDVYFPEYSQKLDFDHTADFPTFEIVGNYSYVASGYSGIRILRIGYSNELQEFERYYPVGSVESVCVDGNYLYVAEGSEGFKLLELWND